MGLSIDKIKGILSHKHRTNDIVGLSAALGVTPVIVSGNGNATANNLYVLTGGSTITMTLPPSPASGDKILFSNLTTVLTCVIARNGNKIMGLAEDMTLDKPNAGFTLTYSGSTYGWIVI